MGGSTCPGGDEAPPDGPKLPKVTHRRRRILIDNSIILNYWTDVDMLVVGAVVSLELEGSSGARGVFGGSRDGSDRGPQG